MKKDLKKSKKKLVNKSKSKKKITKPKKVNVASPKIEEFNPIPEEENNAKEQHAFIPQKVDKYKPIQSYFSWDSIKALWKHQRRFAQRFFVIMQKSNGMIDVQYVYIFGDVFQYNGGAYVVNKDYMKWSDSLQCFVGQYIQGSSLPVDFKFDEFQTIENIKAELKASRVEMNVHPKILLATIKTEVIQKLLRGEELEKLMNRLFMLSVFTIVGIIGILMFLFNKLN